MLLSEKKTVGAINKFGRIIHDQFTLEEYIEYCAIIIQKSTWRVNAENVNFVRTEKHNTNFPTSWLEESKLKDHTTGSNACCVVFFKRT